MEGNLGKKLPLGRIHLSPPFRCFRASRLVGIQSFVEVGGRGIADSNEQLGVRRDGSMIHGEGEIQDGQLEILRQGVYSHCLVIVGQDCDHILLAMTLGSELVYRYRVDDVFSNLIVSYAVGGAEKWRSGQAALKVYRQRGVDMGWIGGREALDLDGSEVALVSATDAHISVSGCCAPGLPGKSGDMGLDARGGVQTVDVDAARIVDEVGLGRADEVPQLIVAVFVSAGYSHMLRLQVERAHAIGILVE